MQSNPICFRFASSTFNSSKLPWCNSSILFSPTTNQSEAWWYSGGGARTSVSSRLVGSLDVDDAVIPTNCQSRVYTKTLLICLDSNLSAVPVLISRCWIPPQVDSVDLGRSISSMTLWNYPGICFCKLWALLEFVAQDQSYNNCKFPEFS